MLTEKTGLRIVGALAVLFILYSLWMGQMKTPGLPGGYASPVFALEFVKSGEDIDLINQAGGGKANEFISKSLQKDSGYIAIYVACFFGVGLVLAKLNSGWDKKLGIAAATCAVLAGVLDLVENRGMRTALSTPVGTASASLADSIRYPSLAKWAFLFLFCLLVGSIFSRRRKWLLIPGLAFVIAALAGLSGVALNLLRPQFYLVFTVALGCWGLGIIWIAIAFTFWPEKVRNKLLAG